MLPCIRDFWATSVLGGKHITNICGKHVLRLVPRCLAKLEKLLGILSPSCRGHLLWIPKESGPGHVTRSLLSLRNLSGLQIFVKAVAFCGRKALGRCEEEEAFTTPAGCHRSPWQAGRTGLVTEAFGSSILDAAREVDLSFQYVSSFTVPSLNPRLEDTAPHSVLLPAHLCVSSIFIADHFVRELSTKQALLLLCALCTAEV